MDGWMDGWNNIHVFQLHVLCLCSLKIDSIRLLYLLSFSVLPSVVIICLKCSKGKQGHNSKI